MEQRLKQQKAEKDLRERFKADAREKQQQADARLAEIRAKVAADRARRDGRAQAWQLGFGEARQAGGGAW